MPSRSLCPTVGVCLPGNLGFGGPRASGRKTLASTAAVSSLRGRAGATIGNNTSQRWFLDSPTLLHTMSSSEEPPAPPSETSPTAAEPPPPRASLGGFSEHGDADTPPPAGRSRGDADADVPPPPADRSPIRPETAALAAAAATAADQACDSTAAFLADTAPRTPAQPKTKQSKALAAIASELVCSICCSVAARAVVANPCGHVFCGGCLERWLRRKRNCPNCQQRLDATAFVAVPALDHVVSALVDASPNLRRRDSIDRRRNRSPVPPTPPPPPSNGFVTAAELLRRSNGAVPPPPTPADTTILGAVRALDPRSDIERAVEGLDGLAIAGAGRIWSGPWTG